MNAPRAIRRQTRTAVWLIVLLWLALTLGSCGREPSTMEWLTAATEANQAATEALVAESPERALEILAEFMESPTPSEMAADDVRVVLQDTAFRLAELALSLEEPHEALGWADRGLALGSAQDLFTANLHVVRGRALELQGFDREAASEYYDALRINEHLLHQSLGLQEEDP